MKYIQNTNKDIQKMLKEIGVKSFDSLIESIPSEIRFKDSFNIGDALSEYELILETSKLKNNNLICFMGNGIYDHYVPSVVDFISSRSEFYTSYTPYQAEVSQGTLQYLYEFQSMIASLSGMEVSNASLYDGASALAEACSMAINISKKKTILLSSTINSKYIDVVKTYLSNRGIEIHLLPAESAYTSMNAIEKYNLSDIACIAIQSPNNYGLIENWSKWSDRIESETLLIGVSDPMALPIIKSPGDCGVDIYCGEGQSLGNYMNLGGPVLGLISTNRKYVRKMPGRIIGKTEDLDSKEGYVLTLQAREQHIRRDKANSNICTNQSLLALRSTIYMSLLGDSGLRKIAELCFSKAQYAANKISEIDGFSILYNDYNFIKEFIVLTKFSTKKIISEAQKEGIGLSSAGNNDDKLLIAVTEKRTKEEIDKLVDFLKRQSVDL
ncbi:MAG: aminomethyl-transferring glycine dehydrogenase [Candidatus Marinimicrobia bacterium]|nr:aminomethyl-transferring glycine dehydrogenase [Flavobacteriales bacterium]MAX13845.1 aminomethyl-transferring glycine dehydrogenase [Candidatus Neomarinimicrobiota bacterium]|tara:strand:- start:40 stop:1359 length:1320 start_codon:yes stop_codon:yes gene_type:complete